MSHPRPLRASALVLPLLALAFSLPACGPADEDPTGGTGGTGNTTTDPGGSGGSGGAGGDTGGMGGTGGTPEPEPQYRKTISGDVTWTVTFDDAAKAAGATDCAYTRHYEGVEDRSAPWLCPSCEIMYLADVQLTAGLDDCFSQVSSAQPNPKEWIGYANGVYFRGAGGPLSEQGTAVVDTTSVQTANQVTGIEASVGGTLGFDVAGTLALGEEEGDPYNGFYPPDMYAAGWPKADPEPYTGNYLLKKGGIVPDGVFKDSLGEPVRLHDFKGSYLVVDMSAMDCPPCQAMASEEEAFVEEMAAQGIEVHVITLLCPSLSNVLGNTTTSMLKSWINKYNLTSPVLADRGWGLSIFEPAIGVDNIGYPSYAVVAPDLTVLDFQTGFGSFDELAAIIQADAQ
ncbi:MAG: redoxin domain-containing protein [Polyangiaceae bacterium]